MKNVNLRPEGMNQKDHVHKIFNPSPMPSYVLSSIRHYRGISFLRIDMGPHARLTLLLLFLAPEMPFHLTLKCLP